MFTSFLYCLASWILAASSISFLACSSLNLRFSSLFCAVSYSYFILLNSSLSLSSAIDISSKSPIPLVSVGSKPLVLTIGILSSSLICLISSSFFLYSIASSSFFRYIASVSSLLTSSLILRFSSLILSCSLTALSF
jgi:hypothetical protein